MSLSLENFAAACPREWIKQVIELVAEMEEIEGFEKLEGVEEVEEVEEIEEGDFDVHVAGGYLIGWTGKC